MNTTDLFVELIIIGIGGAIWLCLLIFGIFGYDWVPLEETFALAAVIPFLSVAYVLGIVIDRIADTVFERVWYPSLLKKLYETEKEYLDDKRLIYIHPGRLGDLLEYGRSRLRICRGWALNAVLILLSLDFFVWVRVTDSLLRIRLLVLGSLLAALFAFGNWFSWRQLNLAYCVKVRGQSAFLRAVQSADKSEDAPDDIARPPTHQQAKEPDAGGQNR